MDFDIVASFYFLRMRDGILTCAIFSVNSLEFRSIEC